MLVFKIQFNTTI